jgi:hypothetical protein
VVVPPIVFLRGSVFHYSEACIVADILLACDQSRSGEKISGEADPARSSGRIIIEMCAVEVCAIIWSHS